MEATRYASLKPSVAPLRSVGGTVALSDRPLRPRPVEELFAEQQLSMARAVQGELRAGLFVFAAHRRFGEIGRLWLEAGVQPRAGLIGRHDRVDLALPLDESLSLRHVLFVVRKAGGAVRLTAVDLETTNGLQLESGEAARVVEGEGLQLFFVSNFVFFCVPTGQPVPWRPHGDDPWATLTPRGSLRLEQSGRRTAGAPLGRLELRGPEAFFTAPVDALALRRGFLVGRDPRCDAVTPLNTVSRVHLALLRLDGARFAFDTGSTNGTFHSGERLKAVALTPGLTLTLGFDLTATWREGTAEG
jgi:hypothetical protein